MKALPTTIQKTHKGRLNRSEAGAVKFIIKKLGIDKQNAYKLLFNDEYRNVYLKYNRMKLDVDLIEVVDRLQKAVKRHINDESLREVKDGAFALGILRSRLFEEEKYTRAQVINTQGIQVNLGFSFKPYKEKKDLIENKSKVGNVEKDIDLEDIEDNELKE